MHNDFTIGQYDQLSDEEFRQSFEEDVLSPQCFNHADHVRIAWIYLSRLSWEEAVEKVSGGLRRLVSRAGETDKYHQTLTVASLYLVRERLRHRPAPEWKAFCLENEDLFRDFRKLIGRHYSDAQLFTTRARTGFVPPDRAPLP
jgi:hypothetical protein